jgi:hypothetical protein
MSLSTDVRSPQNIVAVRLEGGLGDHILGMRVLKFVKMRHPESPLVVFSDSAGQETQAIVAAMSPYVTSVVKIHQTRRFESPAERWRITSIRPSDLAQMLSAKLFINACVGTHMIGAARILNIPLFEILANRTDIVIPRFAHEAASEILKPWNGYMFVAINLANGVVLRHASLVSHLLAPFLADPRIALLNLFTSGYEFPHDSKYSAVKREQTARDDYVALTSMCSQHERMVACVDLPITTVAALLSKCCYFVGVDNGLKHLAWALGIPRTYFFPNILSQRQALRVMPDVHCCLTLNWSSGDLEKHLSNVNSVLQSCMTLPRSPS